MPFQIRSRLLRGYACRGLLAAAAVYPLIANPAAHPQERLPDAHGYITAVQLPDSFDVNSVHVIVTADTEFGSSPGKSHVKNGPMRDAIAVGAWVEVYGDHNRHTKTVTAQIVLFPGHKLTGLAAILKVISTAPELTFEADGYRIRVTQETEVRLPKDMTSQADVHANMWAVYEGKFVPDGTLAATKVRFLADKRPKDRSQKASGDSNQPSGTSPANATATINVPPPGPDSCPSETVTVVDNKIRLDDDIYELSKDLGLQARVRRIGTSLVPAYQKKLRADDPSIIPFDFCAVDDPARKEFHSSGGLILVPAKLVERFQNDDQLAALLADGIAYSLQQQTRVVFEVNRAVLTRAALYSAAEFVPFGGVVASSVTIYEADKELKEQRERVALELMADTGFDPWQAPEAWRRAAPEKLPADMSKLKYPSGSDYWFEMLNIMYKKPAVTSTTVNGSATHEGASVKP